MMQKLKNWGTSQAGAAWLRGKIERYAELKEFEIDSSAKTARVVIQAKGDSENVVLHVDRYELSKPGEIHVLTVTHLQCSREWIQLLAVDHLVGRKIEIPAAIAAFL